MGRNTLAALLLLLVGCATPVPCPTNVGAGVGRGIYFTVWFDFVEESDDCFVYHREFWIEEEDTE